MLEFLFIIVVLLAVLLAYLLLQFRRMESKFNQRLDSIKHGTRLQQQSISGLTAGTIGMDKRIRRLEASEKILSERQETIENQQLDEMPYGHAIKLVQQGSGTERLVDELSLSQSEAELIVRLHGRQPE